MRYIIYGALCIVSVSGRVWLASNDGRVKVLDEEEKRRRLREVAGVFNFCIQSETHLHDPTRSSITHTSLVFVLSSARPWREQRTNTMMFPRVQVMSTVS